MNRLAGALWRTCGAVALLLARVYAIFNKTWRQTLADRLGGGEWASARCVDSQKKDSRREVIWLHGASVGEIAGLRPVVEMLQREHPQSLLVGSAISRNGLKALHASGCFVRCGFLPLDNFRVVEKVLRGVAPRLFVIAETELWPNLFFCLSKLGIPLVIINGRISDYSFPFYRWLRPIFAPVLRNITLVLAQTRVDAQRFADLGVPRERIEVCGSSKYDADVEPLDTRARALRREEVGLEREGVVFVAGSVREGEDLLVINAFKKAREEAAELQMVLAPRHPENFQRVAELLQQSALPFLRRSEFRPGNWGAFAVLLLDTLGELRKFYSVADFVFVGGSLVDIGGHNPLEPAAFAVPVIMGPYNGNVRDAVAELRHLGGMVEVGDEAQLQREILRFVTCPAERAQRARAALQVAQQNRGATARIKEELARFVSEGGNCAG